MRLLGCMRFQLLVTDGVGCCCCSHFLSASVQRRHREWHGKISCSHPQHIAVNFSCPHLLIMDFLQFHPVSVTSFPFPSTSLQKFSHSDSRSTCYHRIILVKWYCIGLPTVQYDPTAGKTKAITSGHSSFGSCGVRLYSVQCSLVTLGTSCSAVYYNRSCLWVYAWVCYHNNSKLRASILTKLGLYVKVVTISSWLNFWPSCPPPGNMVCGGAKIFGSALLQPACSVCVSSEHLLFL